jgi:hypothetical protein
MHFFFQNIEYKDFQRDFGFFYSIIDFKILEHVHQYIENNIVLPVVILFF